MEQQTRGTWKMLTVSILALVGTSIAYVLPPSSMSSLTSKSSSSSSSTSSTSSTTSLFSSPWNDESNDSNKWSREDDFGADEDWQEMLASKKDGSFWSSFEPSAEDKDTKKNANDDKEEEEEIVDDADIWLDALASISSEEIEFNMAEADRAVKVQQMQEWGFDDETVANTFGVAVDDSLEKEEVKGMDKFREEMYLDNDDWKKVESHTKVPVDEETGEPIRQQMVRTNIVVEEV